jgi:hypothetical protein
MINVNVITRKDAVQLPVLGDLAQQYRLTHCGNTHNGIVHEYLYSVEAPGNPLHRFAYAQIWNVELPMVLWVMLNPGTAETEARRRPTLERCIQWSRPRGFGGLFVANLTSVRTKSAKDLLKSELICDPRNVPVLRCLKTMSCQTIVAWGNSGAKLDGIGDVMRLFEDELCLAITKKGQPQHPLYVRGDAELLVWSPPTPSNSARRKSVVRRHYVEFDGYVYNSPRKALDAAGFPNVKGRYLRSRFKRSKDGAVEYKGKTFKLSLGASSPPRGSPRDDTTVTQQIVAAGREP